MITFAVTLLVGASIGYTFAVFRNPLCAWAALYDSVRIGARIGGHSMVEREHINHAIVHILQCERCEAYSVGWRSTAYSVPVGHGADEVACQIAKR